MNLHIVLAMDIISDWLCCRGEVSKLSVSVIGNKSIMG